MSKELDKNIKIKYSLSEYDPNWVNKFNSIKVFLSDVFKNKALKIEHVGSTSIPGMRAKPLIDIVLVVSKMEDFNTEKEQMIKAGYEWGENYIAPNTLLFFKLGSDGDKLENIHVCEVGAPKERQFIIMRDYFRSHPNKAKEYSDLKLKNTKLYPYDYPAYRAAKAPFLQKMEIEAYEWFSKKNQMWHIKIEADRFVYWYSRLTGTKGNAKAMAFYPFLFTTSKIHPKMHAYFINHELIHFAQQQELLIVGAWIFHILEWLYITIIKRKRGMDAYLLRSTEQEAYDNMFDLEYLSKRKFYSELNNYWENKPVVWKDYLKKVLETEGYPIVYEWVDKPNTEYAEHFHKGKVSFYVMKGSVTFLTGITRTVKAGERFDVPVGVTHTAKVSNDGCEYIVGQEIEGDA
jgi:GrpB-like predicted nucleotidyltransferase (UPF0157 family)